MKCTFISVICTGLLYKLFLQNRPIEQKRPNGNLKRKLVETPLRKRRGRHSLIMNRDRQTVDSTTAAQYVRCGAEALRHLF